MLSQVRKFVRTMLQCLRVARLQLSAAYARHLVDILKTSGGQEAEETEPESTERTVTVLS